MRRAVACSIAAAAAALTLAAREKQSPPAAPDKAAEARAAANRVKQDERSRELIKKAHDAYEKALKDNDAATAEIERFKKNGRAPKAGSAKVTLEQLKTSLEKDDLKAFEELFKQAPEPLKAQFNAWREQRRQEGKSPLTPSPPPPPAEPPPVSFDKVPLPSPPPPLTAPDFAAGPTLKAEHVYSGFTNDPRNPDIVLPASDPRTRMVLMRGDVRLRKPLIVLDADEVDVILTEGQENSLLGGKANVKPAASAADPVHPGSVQDNAFERIIARGRVRVMFVDADGNVKIGRGGAMIYDARTGILLVKEYPEAEFAGVLLRGVAADAVIELSNLKAEKPNAHTKGVEIFELQRKLTVRDMPRTPDQVVPAAGPAQPRRSPGTVPASR